MNNGTYLFLLIALFCACIGCASGLVLFDIASVCSLIWAYVVHYMEDVDE